MADCWMANNAKIRYIGTTAHWINVDPNILKWELQSMIISFHSIHGSHTGSNLGQYFVGICDCAGIMSRQQSKVSYYYDYFYQNTYQVALYHYNG